MPLQEDTRSLREEKKQSEVARVSQQPAEEVKKHQGHLRLQTYEEPAAEPFMAARKVDPMLLREQMATGLRKSKRQEIVSKKRNQHGLFQEQEPGFLEHEDREEMMYLEQEHYELPDQADDAEDEDFQ